MIEGCVKCIDDSPKYATPPCKNILPPDSIDVLTSRDMTILGYIKCKIDNQMYLSRADRKCNNYNG